MKNLFVCPHCQAVLNPNVKITLAAQHGRQRGMMLLSPQPGNYKFITDQSFAEALSPGVELTFFCPVCSEELTSQASDRLVELQMVTPGRPPRRVGFSRAHGVRATFIVDEDSVTIYGEDADEFENLNFFGV
jgi:hypothetical protein